MCYQDTGEVAMAPVFYCSQLCKLILANRKFSCLTSPFHWFWFVQSQGVWIKKQQQQQNLRETCSEDSK